VSNTLQDIVLTMFRDVHTDGRTDERRTGQNHYASGHTTFGRGITKTDTFIHSSECDAFWG